MKYYEEMVNEMRRIFKVFLLLFFILWSVFIINYFENEKKFKKLKNKIEQVELDYKFLKYNTEQLEEMK